MNFKIILSLLIILISSGVILISSGIVAAECDIPVSGMEITKNSVLCNGTYYLDTGITISSSYVTLDCNNARLNCATKRYSGIATNQAGVTIKRCNISGCQNGIVLENANHCTVYGNYIEDANIGISMYNSNSANITGNTVRNAIRSIYLLYSLSPGIDTAQILAKNTYEVEPVFVAISTDEIGMETKNISADIQTQNNTTQQQEYAEPKSPDLQENLAMPRGSHAVTVTIEIAKGILLEEDPNTDLNEKLNHILNLEGVADMVNITRDFEYSDNSTIITITIVPKTRLQSFSYYEKIPKCIAGQIKDIVISSSASYKIISDDPLIVWRFEKIKSPQQIKYSVGKVITADCASALSGLGIGEKNINNAIVAIIALFLLICLVLIIKVYSAQK